MHTMTYRIAGCVAMRVSRKTKEELYELAKEYHYFRAPIVFVLGEAIVRESHGYEIGRMIIDEEAVIV